MSDATSAERAGEPHHQTAASVLTPEVEVPTAQPPTAKPAEKRPWWMWVAGGALVLLALYEAIPWAITAFRTESTDDAYVNGHVTFVAPRVPDQVVRVLVDDNYRVRKGDLLVQLDKEPYQVKVDIAQAALMLAQAGIVTAQAKVRGLESLGRSQRFDMANAMHNLNDQVADLHSKVDALQAANATLIKARADYAREQQLFKAKVVARSDFDTYQEAFSVAQAQQQNAQHDVAQVRAELGLRPTPKGGDDLSGIPANLDQTYSAVKVAQARLMQTVAQLGVVQSFKQSPDEMLAQFYKRDSSGNIDAILDEIAKNAPDVKQAEAKLNEAQANLHQAELNLSYCDVVAEIDGVVTRRNVNPGDQVLAGQGLMALRSLTDIWVDANFKETQLANLRIGQPADLDVDMYGSRRRFRGRISGFTMGTGSTLALLPAENATGNFVKVVQRLPVRIELTNYDPDVAPLFIGLSVTPYVYIHETPTGPNAGKMLQASISATGPVSAPGPQ
ncbi:MAG: HlyD family secretion protein [Candidatus Binatus sp.]|jgi:membrane fusion protein (multidrug efflux system)